MAGNLYNKRRLNIGTAELSLLMALLVMPVIAHAADMSGEIKDTARLNKTLENFEYSLSAKEKQLYDLTRQESLEVRRGALTGLVRSKGDQSMPFLKKMLDRPDQAFDVLKLMVDISVPESAPYLIEALEKHIAPDGSRLAGLTEQNILGILQLVRRRSYLKQTIPVLIRMLDDSSPAVRESVALTLGDLEEKESVEPLRKLLKNEPYELVRMSALVSLVNLGDTESRDTLKQLITEGDNMIAINYVIKQLKQRKISIVDRYIK